MNEFDTNAIREELKSIPTETLRVRLANLIESIEYYFGFQSCGYDDYAAELRDDAALVKAELVARGLTV